MYWFKKNEKQIDDEIEFSSKIITKFIPKKPFAIPFIFGLNFETFLAEGRQFALQKFLDTEREGLLWRMHVTMHRSLAPGLFSGALSKRNGHSGASNVTYRLWFLHAKSRHLCRAIPRTFLPLSLTLTPLLPFRSSCSLSLTLSFSWSVRGISPVAS